MEKAEPEKLTEKTMKLLMQSIPFTENDLALNQQYKFSESQKKLLGQKIDLYFYISLCGTIVFFIMSLGFAYEIFEPDELLIMAILCFSAFLASVIGFVWSRKMKRKLNNNEGIKIVAGEADYNIEYDEDSNTPTHILSIKGVRFILDEKLYDAFLGKRFRIYYFRIWRNEVLSVEAFEGFNKDGIFNV